MANLTPQEIDTLVGRLKKHPYLCTATRGGTVTGVTVTGATETVDLNPLSGPPTAAPDTETTDVTLYETLADVQARFLNRNDVTVTITTRNIDAGMAMSSKIKKGDNLLSSTLEYVLTLVPITGDSEPVILFAHAYPQAGLTFNPGENGDPSTVQVTFTCKADATTGVPFVYSTPNT